jgi:hypothetical protein
MDQPIHDQAYSSGIGNRIEPMSLSLCRRRVPELHAYTDATEHLDLVPSLE